MRPVFNLGLDFPKRSDSVFIEINRNGGSVSNYQNYINHLNANDGTTLWFSHLVTHLMVLAALSACTRVDMVTHYSNKEGNFIKKYNMKKRETAGARERKREQKLYCCRAIK